MSSRPRTSPFGSRLLGPRDQDARSLRIRVQVLLSALLVGTNLVGAAVAFVIARFAVPAPPPTQRLLVALAIAVPAYVAAAVLVSVVWGTTTTLRSLRWATVPDMAPTQAERELALRVPARLTAMVFVAWAGATLLFTVLTVAVQPERALSGGLTVGLAGVVVCAVTFLLSELALRPVSARALEGLEARPRTRGIGLGARMVLFWALGTAAPVSGLVVAGILALVRDDTTLQQLAVLTVVLGVVVLVFGLLVAVLSARSVVAPVQSVRDAMLATQQGDLTVDVPVYDGTELGMLQAGFNEMVAGLREREQIRDLFGRHVGREVAQAASLIDGVELGGETRTVSVLFVDLVGSTTYAAEHSPTEVVAVLNRFFGVVVDEVDRRHGLVNKFIGDAVLAIFGAPVAHDDHAAAALEAARVMARRLAEEVPEIGAGIGVATGTVVAGNVGHEERFEYTVVGDAVNAAARLTELAKDVPGRVLAMADSVDAAGPPEADHWRDQGETTLRGRSTPTALAVPAA